MSLRNKILIVVLLLSLISNVVIVFFYERKIKEDENEVTVIGGFKKNNKYTAKEIFELIKNCPEYLGDSVVIYADGKLRTDNRKFQGTIDAVITNDMEALEQQANDQELPRSFLVYKLAAHYYRIQYADEFKKDTLNKN